MELDDQYIRKRPLRELIVENMELVKKLCSNSQDLATYGDNVMSDDIRDLKKKIETLEDMNKTLTMINEMTENEIKELRSELRESKNMVDNILAMLKTSQ